MENKRFRSRLAQANRRKLDMALRRLTMDQLSTEQRSTIIQHLNTKKQYRLRLCATSASLAAHLAAVPGRYVALRFLLGDPTRTSPHDPVVFLVEYSTTSTEADTLYIYLPNMEEEMGCLPKKRNSADATC